MGLMDKVNKVKGLLGQHGDKVGQGLEKAAEAVDSKTKGKYSAQIKTGTEKAKEAVAGLAEKEAEGAGAKDADGKKAEGKDAKAAEGAKDAKTEKDT